MATVAMVLASCGAILQGQGAQRATKSRPAVVQPRWLAGIFCDLLGWLCQVVALRVLPVFAVQAIIGGAIALTALIGARLAHARLPRNSQFAVTGCLAGLVLVAASAGPTRQPEKSPTIDIVLLVAVLLLGVAVIILRQGKRAWPLAIVSGMGFGGTALSVRAAYVQTGDGFDIVMMLGQPSTYLIVGFWLIGMVGHAAALARGDVGPVTAVFTVTQVLAPGMAGIALLGDPVRVGWWWVLTLGLALAVVGSIVLAKAPPLRKPRTK